MLCYHFEDQAPAGCEMHISFLDRETLSRVAIPHTHDYREIFFMYEGAADHFLNGQTEPLPQGTLAFLQPEDVHGFIRLEGAIRCVNIIFQKGRLERIAEAIGGPELLAFINGDGRQLQLDPTIAKCLMDASLKYSMFPEPEPMRLLLLALGQAMLSGKLSHRRPRMPAWLDNAVRKYQFPAHFTQPIDQLYVLCGHSREHVCRSFRRYLGMTPTRFINDLRLAHAHYLLHTTSHSVMEICLLCGFDSISHFNHLFRERYGSPPSKCR